VNSAWAVFGLKPSTAGLAQQPKRPGGPRRVHGTSAITVWHTRTGQRGGVLAAGDTTVQRPFRLHGGKRGGAGQSHWGNSSPTRWGGAKVELRSGGATRTRSVAAGARARWWWIARRGWREQGTAWEGSGLWPYGPAAMDLARRSSDIYDLFEIIQMSLK
jgi:hypothetical protein